MSRPSNPAVWRMNDHDRARTVARHTGRWCDVITNLGREASTAYDRTVTGEVLGVGTTNFGTVSLVVIVREAEGNLRVLSLATVRRFVDHGPANVDALLNDALRELTPIPFPGPEAPATAPQ